VYNEVFENYTQPPSIRDFSIIVCYGPATEYKSNFTKVSHQKEDKNLRIFIAIDRFTLN